MVWMEFFKKHKNRLLGGCAIFLGCLLLIACMIASPGLFLGLSLIGFIVVTVLWLGFNGLMDTIGKWVQKIKNALVALTQWLHDPSVSLDHSNHAATNRIEDHDHPSDTKLSSKDECVEYSPFQKPRNVEKFNTNTPHQEAIGLDKNTTKNKNQFRLSSDIQVEFFSSKAVDKHSNQNRFDAYFNLRMFIALQAREHSKTITSKLNILS